MPLQSARKTMLLTVAFEGGLGVAAIAIGWLVGRPFWELLDWNGRDVVLGLAATAPMLVVLFACVYLPLRPLVELQRLVERLVRLLFGRASILELAVVSLMAGLGEELLFRGLIQTVAVEFLGVLPGLAIASVVFGLAHPMSKTYFVLAALIGAYLGWLLLATGNLLVPIVAHAAYDFAALVYILRSGRR